ncbi:G-type lectin S-receptor-like serine/threonine-protein kinase LECRK1 [Ziziphus jujuba]|uniref:Receptor-like serine/threonine-protein kinase n=1 Tax=Ziziphus jujuba TaxID=326968 RepID=A0A6P4AXW0_ZIZJJ|nr:G-type lectin S-receptor-like serine/threonine-protein kinase LECRK1 [Ziziphus jujuba]
MASIPILLIILSVFSVAMNAKAQTEYPKNITRGSILSPNTINSSWPSPSGLFSFGFYPEGNGFRVGIWMATDKPETRVVVWTANPDVPPCSPDATLELKGRLVLRTEQGEEKNVTYNDDLPDPATSAAMLDDGNFQLFNGSGYLMWQSFDYPTDTILGGQVLTSDSWLQSSISRSDHSSGLFMLRMQNDGNLVCYPANISNNPDTAYWSSGTFSYAAMLNLSHLGYLSLEGSYGKPIRFLSNGSYPVKNKTIIHRATLDSDGIFRKYSHYIVSNVSSKVTEKWSSMQNPCDVKGICGLNSFCQVVNNKSECSCYPGFVSVEPSMMFLGCYQNFSAESYGDKEEADPALRYNFTSLNNIRWDDPPYTVEILMEEACKGSCMNDFNCWAVLYESTRCRKYNFPLRYGKQSKDITTKALFKVKNIGMAKESNHNHPAPANDESRIKTVMFILGLSLGSVACLCFAFAVSSFIAYKHKYHRYKKLLENTKLGLAEDFTLQSFSYNELQQATNGFSEEKGRGTFGAVYKGILSEGNKTIAVKRLEKFVEEGVREFRAEMTTIGRTHHRNLVQLLGFCIEGSKKILVYEFMSNGSLADRLFKAVSPPTWQERVRFVFDVARGMFYLHEECGVHIIHCNLKPQNILLDDTWTAKISDFGLARLLPNQAKTSMGVQGTSLQYLAPEWQKNSLISVKADIYSFGIVLLEIICCRRNIEVNVSTPDEITLSKWVYKCFKARELHKLVEVEEVHFPTLERMIKVGLWCIQDDPDLRPLMKNVILMLEGTVNISEPPSPELIVLP